MSEFKIFYSWQSDLPNATNRGLIQEALERAAKEIRRDDSFKVDPVIDRDTLGCPGAPSIDQVIFEKISGSDAYVADISIVNRELLEFVKGEEDLPKRPTCNPNVLLELGFAVRALGWDRVILVFNTSTGDPVGDLPFDLRQKRRIQYLSNASDIDRAQPRKELEGKFSQAFKDIIMLAEAEKLKAESSMQIPPFERAVNSIEGALADRVSRTRDFCKWFLGQIDDLNPLDRDTEEWLQALKTTTPLMSAYSKVVEAAAIADDEKSIWEIWRLFDQILKRYESPPNFSGSFLEVDFDWWKFHGHEMCVIVTLHLLREGKLDLLGRLLDDPFVTSRPTRITREEQPSFLELSRYVLRIVAWNEEQSRKGQNAYLSPQGHWYRVRYEDGTGNLPTWEEFMGADLLLTLVSLSSRYLRSHHGWSGKTITHLAHSPEWLLRARNKFYATSLQQLFGAPSMQELRDWIAQGWRDQLRTWRAINRMPIEDVEGIGTR